MEVTTQLEIKKVGSAMPCKVKNVEGVLGGSVGRGCWKGVLERSVGRECWKGVLEGSVGRGCWKGVLDGCVGWKCWKRFFLRESWEKEKCRGDCCGV